MIYLFSIFVIGSVIVTRQMVVCLSIALLSVLLAESLADQISWSLAFFLYFSLLALPLSVGLIGHLSAGVFEQPSSRKLLSFLAVCFGFFMLFESDFFLLSLTLVMKEHSSILAGAQLLQILNKLAFCVGLIGMLLVAIIALTELPAYWCLRRQRSLTRYLSVLRPAILVVICTLLFDKMMYAVMRSLS